MKKLFFLAAIFCTISARSQSSSVFCVQTNCPITIQLPVDSALIFGTATLAGDTISSYQWKVTGTGGTLSTPASSQSWVKGLNTAGTYTFSLTATTKHGAILTNAGSAVTVLAAIPPTPIPRTVVSVVWKLVNGVWTASFLFSDGTTQ